jgi:hypothetical protein
VKVCAAESVAAALLPVRTRREVPLTSRGTVLIPGHVVGLLHLIHVSPLSERLFFNSNQSIKPRDRSINCCCVADRIRL